MRKIRISFSIWKKKVDCSGTDAISGSVGWSHWFCSPRMAPDPPNREMKLMPYSILIERERQFCKMKIMSNIKITSRDAINDVIRATRPVVSISGNKIHPILTLTCVTICNFAGKWNRKSTSYITLAVHLQPLEIFDAEATIQTATYPNGQYYSRKSVLFASNGSAHRQS